MVILNNFDQYPAPSMSALSYNSSGTFWIPPNRMIKLIPRCIQTVVIATEKSAQSELVSHSTPSIPTSQEYYLTHLEKDGIRIKRWSPQQPRTPPWLKQKSF